MSEERIKRQCQHCGNHTVFEVHGTYLDKEELAKDIYHITEWRMIGCMTCSKPMLEQTTKVIQERRRGYEEEYEEWEETVVEHETSILYPATNMTAIPLSIPDMPQDGADAYNQAR